MRSLRVVSSDEFQAFIAGKELTTRAIGSTVHYLEPGEFPENIVASFRNASSMRPRPGDWRIANEPQKD